MRVFKIKNGYCYKELKNGKKIRISKEEYLKLSKKRKITKSTKQKKIINNPRVYRTKKGYFYKEFKNGKKKRISKEQYLKLKKTLKGGAGC